MRKRQPAESMCPYFKAGMAILSRRWAGLVLAVLAESPRLRFGELRDRLSRVGDRMLAVRLKELEADGLVERRVEAGPPVRVVYSLTDVGREFQKVIDALSAWGVKLEKKRAQRVRR